VNEHWLSAVPIVSIALAICVAAAAQDRAEAVSRLYKNEKEITRLRKAAYEMTDVAFDVAQHCEDLWTKHRLRCEYDLVHSPGGGWLRDRVALECPRCTIGTRFVNAD